MVDPHVHEVEGGGGEDKGGMVGHRQLERILVATSVGQGHLETGVELENGLGRLGRGGEGRQL